MVGGAAFGYAQLVLVTVVGLWLTPFLLRMLGVRELGLWMAGTQLLGYLALLDLGVAAILPRDIAAATGLPAAERARSLSALASSSMSAALVQTPVVLLAAAACVAFVVPEDPGIRGPVALAAAGFVLLFPARLFQAVLQGLQELSFVGRTQLTGWTVGTAIAVALVASGWRLYSLAIGWVATQGYIAIACWVRLHRSSPELAGTLSLRASLADARRRVSSGLWVSIGQVAQVLVAGTDAVVVAAVAGPAAVVPLTCTGKLATVLSNHPFVLVHSAAPALAELRTSAAQERLYDVCAALSRSVLVLSGLIAVAVLTVNAAFVSWWVGEEQYAGATLTVAVVAVMMLRHLNVTIAQLLFSFGHERRLAVTGILDGIACVAGMWLLVPRLGILGAPLAQAFAVATISLPYHLFLLGRTLGGLTRRYIASMAGWFLRALGPICGALAWLTFFSSRSLLVTATAAVVIVLVYGTAMIPILRSEPLRGYLGRAIRSVAILLPRRHRATAQEA
jgi:O-antigen/teichoic acid export membrane protein